MFKMKKRYNNVALQVVVLCLLAPLGSTQAPPTGPPPTGSALPGGSSNTCVPKCDALKPDPNDEPKANIFFDFDGPNCYTNQIVLTTACLAYTSLDQKLKLEFFVGAGAEKLEDGSVACQYTDCTKEAEFACVKEVVEKKVETLCCMAGGNTGENCCKIFGADYAKVKDCIDKKKGVELILKNRDARFKGKIKLNNLPAISFNDVFDECTSKQAVYSLFTTTCEMFKTKPPACTGAAGGGSSGGPAPNGPTPTGPTPTGPTPTGPTPTGPTPTGPTPTGPTPTGPTPTGPTPTGPPPTGPPPTGPPP